MNNVARWLAKTQRTSLGAAMSTSLVSGATAAAGVLVIRLLATRLEPDEFGAYALTHRYVALAAALLTFNIGFALLRFLPISSDTTEKGRLLVAGCILGISPTLAVAAGLWASSAMSPEIWSAHNLPTRQLIEAGALLLLGFAVYTVLNALYFGTSRSGRANVWQLLIGCVGPIAVAVMSETALTMVVGLAAVYFAAAIPLGIEVARSSASIHHIRTIAKPVRFLFHFGAGRLVGTVGLVCLMNLSTYLAPVFGSVREAGYLIVGQALLRIVEVAASAFGTVVLSRATKAVANEQWDTLSAVLTQICAATVHLGAFVTVQLVIWSDVIVSLWLGSTYSAALAPTRMIIVAATPYLAFMVLRPFIEAREDNAVTTRHVLVALAITSAISVVAGHLWGVTGLAFATAIGFWILAGLSANHVVDRYLLRLKEIATPTVIAINILFVVAALTVKAATSSLAPQLQTVTLLAALTLSLLGYLLILRLAHVSWIVEFEARLYASVS